MGNRRRRRRREFDVGQGDFFESVLKFHVGIR